MARSRLDRAWVVPASVIGATMLAGLFLPVSSALYAQAYSRQGSNIIKSTGGRFDLSQALTDAKLSTLFAPARVTEDVATTFTATITYDRSSRVGRKIKVAYSNDAVLKVAKGKFDIEAVSDPRQNLDEGTRLPGGGFELSWVWQITPRQSGRQSLVLEIQPVLLLGHSQNQTFEARNQPLQITVQVHPNEQCLRPVDDQDRGGRTFPSVV
jgi:hypothetical protein